LAAGELVAVANATHIELVGMPAVRYTLNSSEDTTFTEYVIFDTLTGELMSAADLANRLGLA
jgi:hypothetical protein